MEERRLRILTHLALMLSILVFALSACSMPRIVVFNDPLSAKEHIDLGVIYEQKGMLDLAEKEYLKAVDKQSTWAIPYFNLGNVAYKRKNLKGAEGYYRKALTLDNQNPDIMNNLASLLHETGRDDEAKTLMEKALSLQRKDQYLDTERTIKGGE
jgi:Flp pilus assembly protein TadD